jgi:nicotinate-nucleotide--dimethylbenzimidazole phosphoribosyltransferase
MQLAVAAQAELDQKTKPRRSLGRLEQLAVQIAAVRGTIRPAPLAAAVVVAAADHGYAANQVSAYPQQVTAQMLQTAAAGGAAISVLARQAPARLVLVDVGLLHPLRHPNIRSLRIAAGTRDATHGPAMTKPQTLRALAAGSALARELAADGISLLAPGEIGIGNTTAASALTAAMLGLPPRAVCGRGTGLDDAGLRRKIATVEAALAANSTSAAPPLETLAALGGLEIAFLTGAILGAAANKQLIVLDGLVVAAAALIAARLAPDCSGYLIAAHRSPEPGHRHLLEALQLEPLLQWQLRLGEASGAALTLPLIHAAAALLSEMATFESAGVSDSGR